MNSDSYYTIEKPVIAEFKDRGSRFIVYAYPIQTIDEFKIHLTALKKEHPKAVHHCFAYRIGIDGNNFRVSDDGEPSGTAGRPILGQVDSKELTNTLIIVVRYFGGTLLGVPGLINAYKTSALLVLQNAVLIRKTVTKSLRLQFDYVQLNDMMQLFRKHECEILKREMGLFCVFELEIPIRNYSELIAVLEKMKGIEVL
jgi:uncharacterized YigZ family protein